MFSPGAGKFVAPDTNADIVVTTVGDLTVVGVTFIVMTEVGCVTKPSSVGVVVGILAVALCTATGVGGSGVFVTIA